MSATAAKTNGQPRVVPPPSPGPRSLAEAVLAVQAAAPKLRRNEPGQVGSRSYMYTTISALKEDIGPLLIENGLLWRPQLIDNERGEPAVRYRMTHVPSGDEDEGIVTLKGVTDSQSFGSAATYMRRYALVAYLDLVSEDDDGAAASASQGTNQGPNGNHPPSPVAAEPKPTERQLSDAQRRLLSVRSKDLTQTQLANVVSVALGGAPRLWDDEATAKRWVERELDRLPARLVDAVLEGITSCPPF